jgi:hypothetical protein
MDGEAVCHFQRQRIDLLAILLGEGRGLAPEPLQLTPADLLELLV